MLTFNEALIKLLSFCNTTHQTQQLPLSKLANHILAQDITCPADHPAHPTSQMDGYAVNSKTFPDSQTLPLSIESAAGDPLQNLPEQTAARIYTGALLPNGADCVIRQEDVVPENGNIRFSTKAKPLQFVRAIGSDLKANEVLLTQGTQLTPQNITLIASIGLASALVYKPLHIHFISSGNELIQPGNPIKLGEIYDSNTSLVLQHLQAWNFTFSHSHLPDDLEQTEQALAQASQTADIIISTGGVSVGDHDYLRVALEKQGELHLWRILMKPGRPLAFGKINQTYYFGLPGNPVSAFVTLLLFAKPFLMQMQGLTPKDSPTQWAFSDFDWAEFNSRRVFLRGRMRNDQGKLKVSVHDNQNSSALSSIGWANVLIEIPEQQAVRLGDKVTIHPIA